MPGRGRPFQKGNPGKPKGARNKRTLLHEVLTKKQEGDIRTAVIEAAIEGDLVAARMVWDRIYPIRTANEQELMDRIEELEEMLKTPTRAVA